MGMIGDFYVRLSAMTAPYTESLIAATDEGEAFTEANRVQMDAVKESNESGGESFGLLGKATVGIAAAFIGVSAVSLKWATSFQSTMETLHTQAGVAQSQIGTLGNGVLALAGKVGFSPDSLAEALYHIESSFASVGITGAKALQLLQIAAEGAATGHADLVDVTNALDAAVVSGIPGVQNLSQAMGILNATVGAGDMTMQDLANAFSTGLLANVKSYGLSITDVGAALAVFGDNNIRGQNAATDLRMAVQAMAVPAATAAADLQKMGLSTTSLATVMSKQGLLPALELLKQKMTSIGVTAQDQGEVLTQLFGKKAGAGIVVLYDQLDRLKGKYPDLAAGANNFASAWQATKATVKSQLDQIGAAAQAAGIKFGQFLLPQVSKLLTLITGPGETALSGFASSIGKDFTQFAAGFSGNAGEPPAATNFHNAHLNQGDMATTPTPQLTAWQKIGVMIRGVATDFERFGKDVVTAAGDAVRAAKPVEQVLADGLGKALVTLGKVLANVVGPAFVAVFGFLASHQGLVKFFAEVILGGLIAKLLILKTIDAATGITKLATSIVSFPMGQVGDIGKAFGGLKTAWLGSADKNGVMVGGLKNALTSMYNTLRGGARTALKLGKDIGSSVASGLSSAGGALKGAATKAFGSIKDALPTKLDAKIFLQSVKDLGGQVATTIKGWGSGIASAASSAASGLSTLATNAATAVSSFASSAWSTATDALSTMGTSIATAATAAWGWVTSATAATLQAGRAALAWTADKIALIGTAIAEKTAAIGQWLLDAAMDANPVTLIVIAIVALIGVFVLLWTHCAAFRDFWKGLWSDIKKLIADAVSFVKTHIDLLVGVLMLPLLPLVLLLQHWSQVWGDIKAATSATWQWLDSNVIQPIKRVFTVDLPAAVRLYLRMWQDTWTGIRTAAQAVWSWLDSNVLHPAESFFSTVIVGALSTAKNVWNSVWGAIQSTVQTAWNIIKPIFDAIKGAISTISGGISGITGAAGKIGGGIVHDLNPLNWDEGGWVPGAKGTPVFGVVHGGEYVLSADMISGRAPIDNRALTGVLSAQGGAGGGGGNTSALAVGPSGGGGSSVTVVNINVQVAGNVTSERKLTETIRTNLLQWNLRNSNNGLSLA